MFWVYDLHMWFYDLRFFLSKMLLLLKGNCLFCSFFEGSGLWSTSFRLMMLQQISCPKRVVDYHSTLYNSLCWIIIYLVFFNDVCFVFLSCCFLSFLSSYSLFSVSFLFLSLLVPFSSLTYICLFAIFFLSYISFLSFLPLLFVKLLIFPSYVCVFVFAQKKPKQKKCISCRKAMFSGFLAGITMGERFGKEKEA